MAWAADIDYLKTTIQTHFSENRHHSVNPDYKLAARDFIAAEFTRFGLKVEKQTFNGDPDNAELKGVSFYINRSENTNLFLFIAKVCHDQLHIFMPPSGRAYSNRTVRPSVSLSVC